MTWKVTSITACRRCRTCICLRESFSPRMFAVKSFETGDLRLPLLSKFPAGSSSRNGSDWSTDSDILLSYVSSRRLSRKDSVCFTVRSCFWEGVERACSCKLSVYSASSSSSSTMFFAKRYRYNHMVDCRCLLDHNSPKY